MSEAFNRRWLRPVLLVGIPGLAALVVLLFWLWGGRYVSTENAYVKAHIAQISAEIAGRILEVHVHDPVPVQEEAMHEYGIELTTWEDLPVADAIIVAVAHRQFLARPIAEYAKKMVKKGTFIDVKSQFDRQALEAAGLCVWRL